MFRDVYFFLGGGVILEEQYVSDITGIGDVVRGGGVESGLKGKIYLEGVRYTNGHPVDPPLVRNSHREQLVVHANSPNCEYHCTVYVYTL